MKAKPCIDEHTALEDLAGLVCTTLEAHGISVVLSGGAEHVSYDLDFVPTGLARKIDAAMESLGFEKSQHHWTHPDSRYWVEFPPGPVAIGEETTRAFAQRETRMGTLQLLAPTECVMDRLDRFLGLATSPPSSSWLVREEENRKDLGSRGRLRVYRIGAGSDSSGNILRVYELAASVVERQCSSSVAAGGSHQGDTAQLVLPSPRVISTDPPYYDNIGYADLSDFFYTWLRRSLRAVFPELFATVAVRRAEELVATPYRHGSKEKAEGFSLDGMTRAMHRLAREDRTPAAEHGALFGEDA